MGPSHCQKPGTEIWSESSKLYVSFSFVNFYMTNIKFFNEIVNLLYDIIVTFFVDICFMTKDELKIAIGRRIIALRTKKGWNQADLARACNKDRQAIEKIENGKVNPTIYSLYEVAKGLQVSLTELLDFHH